MSVSAKIQQSTDYKLFEMHGFNRPEHSIDRLKASMKKHGWIDAFPMHVVKNGSGKLKIKAGHHRFLAATELGIPVKYVVCDDSISIYELELTHNSWSLKDFLMSYVNKGFHEYLTLYQYVAKNEIPINSAISILSGESTSSGNKTAQFKRGSFRTTPKGKKNARQLEVILTVAKKINKQCAINQKFVDALAKILFIDIDINRLCKKISAHSYLIERKATVADYLQLIEDIYNRQSKEKKNIAFLALEASRNRQKSFGK